MAEALVPPLPLVWSAPTTASASWFEALLRWTHRATLSAAERELLREAEAAAAAIGAPLLDAANVAELDCRIAEAIESPALGEVARSAMRHLTFEAVAAMHHAPEVDPDIVAAIGAGPANIVERSMPRVAASAMVAWQLLLQNGPPDDRVASTSLIDFVSRPTVHPRVSFAIIGGFKANAAFLAIAHAAFSRKKLAPWLGLALAERFRDGVHDSLRLLAALPLPTPVPESVFPMSDRLDLATLDREVAEREAKLQELASLPDTPDGMLAFADIDDDP